MQVLAAIVAYDSAVFKTLVLVRLLIVPRNLSRIPAFKPTFKQLEMALMYMANGM